MDYFDPFELGFRPGFDTETALIVLVGDYWQICNGSDASILLLLDFSEAFDTINHGILDWLQELQREWQFILQLFSCFLQGQF